MQTLALKTAINGLALWLAALILPGIRLGEEAAELSNRLVTILLVALVFGLVNTLIKPFVKILSFPLTVLTLGLFTVVVNALMLVITAAIAEAMGLDFRVDSFFWAAILGSLVVSFVSMLLSTRAGDGRRREG